MDDIRTHSTHHQRHEQRSSCRTLQTNCLPSTEAKIDKQPVSPKCRLCGTKEETVMHLFSGFPKLAQKQYKRRHDNVARRVHWELCKKHGLENSDRWYEHTPPDVVENDEVEYYPDRHDSGTQQARYYPS